MKLALLLILRINVRRLPKRSSTHQLLDPDYLSIMLALIVIGANVFSVIMVYVYS